MKGGAVSSSLQWVTVLPAGQLWGLLWDASEWPCLQDRNLGVSPQLLGSTGAGRPGPLRSVLLGTFLCLGAIIAGGRCQRGA